ncbi:MAG: T9SS type A sorting domain-containing protein, partial [Flavobacteriales bacterium]|nr:T9SS type A sorting domain-containing protein [Flavobacteriales bacterium]
RIYTKRPPNNCGFGSGYPAQYQFRFRQGSVCIVRPPVTNNVLQLNWTAAPILTCGEWEVDMRASIDGGPWCPAGGDCETPWGTVAIVNITQVNTVDCPMAGGGQGNMAPQPIGEFTLYPNPNRGDQFSINLTDLPPDVETVDMDIFDMTGRSWAAQRTPVQGGYLNTTVELPQALPTGVYMVRCSAGAHVRIKSMVVQP